MYEIIVLFAAVIGWFLLTLTLAKRWIWSDVLNIYSAPIKEKYAFIILVSVSWFMSMGTRGLIAMWSYYLDISSAAVLYFTGAIGAVGFIVGFHWLQKAYYKIKAASLNPHMSSAEYSICGLLLLLVVVHIHRGIAPWLDWDEMAVYGFYAKLISNGYTYSDIGIDWRTSLFAESLDAVALSVVRDTYLARVLRLLNLVACASLLFAFLQILTQSRTISLLCIAAFFATPEVIYLGTSLKADSVIMCFELAALILAFFVAKPLLYREHLQLSSKVSIAIIAIVFSMMAVGGRLSGIYVAAYVNLIGIYLVLRYVPLTVDKLKIFFILVVAGCLCSARYLYNAKIYGNPIHPFVLPGPLNFNDTADILPGLRDLYNIQGIPPPPQTNLPDISPWSRLGNWSFGALDARIHCRSNTSCRTQGGFNAVVKPRDVNHFCRPSFF
jgi:hypothetical protein